MTTYTSTPDPYYRHRQLERIGRGISDITRGTQARREREIESVLAESEGMETEDAIEYLEANKGRFGKRGKRRISDRQAKIRSDPARRVRERKAEMDMGTLGRQEEQRGMHEELLGQVAGAGMPDIAGVGPTMGSGAATQNIFENLPLSSQQGLRQFQSEYPAESLDIPPSPGRLLAELPSSLRTFQDPERYSPEAVEAGRRGVTEPTIGQEMTEARSRRREGRRTERDEVADAKWVANQERLERSYGIRAESLPYRQEQDSRKRLEKTARDLRQQNNRAIQDAKRLKGDRTVPREERRKIKIPDRLKVTESIEDARELIKAMDDVTEERDERSALIEDFLANSGSSNRQAAEAFADRVLAGEIPSPL